MSEQTAGGEWSASATLVTTMPFAVRTALGLSVLAIGANVVGAFLTGLLIVAVNASATHHQVVVLFRLGFVVTAASILFGVGLGTVLQRRTLNWMLNNRPPTARDTLRVARLPLQMGLITVCIWAVDAALFAIAALITDASTSTALRVGAGIMLAGLTTAAITYLLVARAAQPVLEIAMRVNPPGERPTLGVRSRLLLYWLLTSAVPLIGIVLILTGPDSTRLRVGALAAVLLSLAVGVFANILLARALGNPLRSMVDAVHAVGRGDLTVSVTVADSGEIGLLESGINDMVAGLRERDRVQDLFGRHVGPAVAAEALRSGVTLSGETRDVVALFVDITGSTALTRRVKPSEFVGMLNRFFEVVVSEVESHGGLVNKFEGDAALCVFGAPVSLIDAPTAALIAARRIRDRVVAAGEVSIGIGVAAGPVVAGQIGSSSRLEYTVIGDAVNEAARLTDLAKGLPGCLVASEAVLRAASPVEREKWHTAGEVTLRGRDVATHVWTA